MTGRRILAAVLAAGLAAAAAVVGVAPAASAATPAASLVVAPDGGGILRSGQDLGVTLTVSNTGDQALPAGRIDLSLDKAPIASTSTLLDKIAHPDQVLLGYLAAGATATVPALPEGGSTTVRITVRSDVLSSILSSASGARLLYARYRAAQLVQTVADSAVVRMSGGTKAAVGLSTIIPITAPAGTTGVVNGTEQQQLAGPDGGWGRALRAAEADPSAAIALDPAVIASIRLAGDGAPMEARDFLDRLSRLPNDFVRLPYADTDLTLARAAGSTRSLDPASLAGATVAAETTGPTPAPTATAGTSSTTATDLTDWNWSDEQIAWPFPHTTSAADLSTFTARKDRVLLASDDVVDSTERQQSGPLARIGETEVLVSDATTSTLLAAASADGIGGASALATLTGLLATAAVSGETTGLLATIGRTSDTTHLDHVLDLLDRQRWIRTPTLAGLGDATTAAAVRLRPHAPAAAQVATARALIAGERQVRVLGSAVVSGADTVTAPQHLALLGALSTAWRADPSGWPAAASTVEQGFTAEVAKVSLPQGADTNAIGTDGRLPVTVRNDLAVPIRVVVKPSVSNGRLQFPGGTGVTITVPAQASSSGRLVFKSITNGSTDVTLTLETPSGTRIGPTVVRGVTVTAGFDTIVAVVLLAALGLLLALGVYRNVKRRRQPRPAAAA